MRKEAFLYLPLAIALCCGLPQIAGAQDCSFVISNPNPCPGEAITLTATPADSTFVWDFDGDGNIDATGNPVTTTYPYLTAQTTYTIRLFFASDTTNAPCSSQTITVKAAPDVAIGLFPDSSSANTTMVGNTIKTCSGISNTTIAIFNLSSNQQDITSYEINWGDGVVETYSPGEFADTNYVTHTYTSLGYKTLSVKAIHVNGCVRIRDYVYYSGSNPSVGLANPGNTVGLCAPATITFPITNTANNPPGTQYTVKINGMTVQTFYQYNVPSEFTYTFEESSCDETTSSGTFHHAFDVQIFADNPCGVSAATIEPIEISLPPQVDFLIDPPPAACPGETWHFIDNSLVADVISGTPTECEDDLIPSWMISPGTNGNEWTLESGNLFQSEEIAVRFDVPGTYTIKMTVTSSICGPQSITKQIVVEAPPQADAVAWGDPPSGCVPAHVTFENFSTGNGISYLWEITPPTGWTFVNGTDAYTEEPEVLFFEPGTYDILLRVTNVCAMDTWDTTLVFIGPPDISLDPLPDFCTEAVLSFSQNTVSYQANGTPITSYQWTFPGATPAMSSEAYPQAITYPDPGTYVVSVSAANACGTTTIADTFDIQAPVSISFDEVPAGVCIDAPPLALMAMPAGGSWSGPGVVGDTMFPELACVGSHALVYAVQTGICTWTDTVGLAVWPLPVVDAGADVAVCESEEEVALSGTPAGGVWTASGGVLSGSSFLPSASGAGTYVLTYSYTDSLGCSNSDDKQVRVHALPQVMAGDTSYCNSEGAYALPYATPEGGVWTGPGITGMTFNPVAAGGVGTYQASYVYTDANGCTDSAVVTLEVVEPAAVWAGPDTLLCASETTYDLSLQASPSDGVWLTTSVGLTGSVFDASAAGVGTHLLEYRYGTGSCEVRDTVWIEVVGLPVVDAGADVAVCESEEEVALSGTPAGGVWTASGGVLSGSSFLPSASGTGTYVLTYSYTDSLGCNNSDDKEVTVHALPQVMAGDTSYCNSEGAYALPHATPEGGVWTGPGITGMTFNPVAAGGVGTYQASYVYTDANGCTDSAVVTLEVVEPAAVWAGPDTLLCASETAYDLSLQASPSGGVWLTTSVGLTGSVFDASEAGVGTHLLEYRYGEGSCEVRDTVWLEVVGLPVVDAGADVAVCESEEEVALSGTPAGGTWTASGGVLSGSSFLPSASGAGTYVLTYSYTDSLGCSNSDDKEVTVHALPQVVAGDTVFCNTPGPLGLPDAFPAGGVWSGPGVEDNAFHPDEAGGVGTYTLVYTYSDAFGCTDSTQATVEVIELPEVEAGPDDTICGNAGLYHLQDYSPAGGTWSGPGIVDGTQGIFEPLVAGGGLIEVAYTYGAGNCEVTDTRTLFVVLPDVQAGTAEAHCLAEGPVVLSGATPSGGYWTGPGIVDSLGGVFDPAAAGVGVHEVTYVFKDTLTGCTFFPSKQVTVHPMPQSQFAIPAEACADAAIAFQNQSASTWQVLWDFGDGTTSSAVDPTHAYDEGGWYTVTLHTTNEFGCTDSIAQQIYVATAPALAFEPDVHEGCAVLEVNFTNNSSGYQTSWLWDFGNGLTDTTFQPGPVLYDQGTADTTYVVTLTGTNLCAGVQLSDTITVYPRPTAIFGTSIDSTCSPAVVAFANVSTGLPQAFFWDFGNGFTSTDSVPGSQTYYADSLYQTYTITLVATNDCGADTATHDIVVAPPGVEAFFNIPTDTGCQPFELAFTSYATSGATVYWDFGDGNTSSLTNPVHVFEEPGTFTVVQYATTGCGYDSTTAVVHVLPAPEVSFTHLPEVCQGDSVQFLNTSPSPLAGTQWIFGDGDSSLLGAPWHVFDTAGIYTVTLVGTSSVNGCRAEAQGTIEIRPLPQIVLAPDPPDGCAPLTVQFGNLSAGADFFVWHFGDGNSATQQAPTHTYQQPGNYAVVLEGRDAFGCTDTAVFEYVHVFPVPQAGFEMERDRLCGYPVQVQMVNTSQGAEGFFWLLGDGTQSALNEPMHTYDQPGTWAVTLIAENAYHCMDTMVAPLVVYPQPMADFDASPLQACTPVEVQFQNHSTGSNGYLWRFGDGTTSTAFEPAQVYAESGTYAVTLIANYDNVCFDTLRIDSMIQALPVPFANFDWEEVLQGQPAGIIQFHDLSANAAWHLWDFGDGTVSEEQNPRHRYYQNGAWQVHLEVTAPNGCTDDTLRLVTPDFFKGLYIPNAFSPEQGIGDVRLFRPRGAGLKEYRIEVYSPWGQLLWWSDKLENGQPAEAWDGRLDGKLLPQDVYVWKAFGIFEDGTVWRGMPDGKGGFKTMGTVVLLR